MSTESYTVPAGVFSGATQAEADLKAYTYACYLARLKCHPHVTPIISEDMPLDQAVYSSSRGRIYAVRSGYIYEFDESGTKLTSKRYTNGPSYGQASIAYDSGADNIYVSYWDEPMNMGNASPVNNSRGIWRISPATLTGTFIDLNTIITAGLLFGPQTANTFGSGPRQIACISGHLIGTSIWSPVYEPQNIVFMSDLPTLATGDRYRVASTRDSWFDICWDSNLNVLWFTGSEWDGLYGYDFATSTLIDTAHFGLDEGPTGICQASASWLYSTNKTPVLVKFASAHGGAFSVIDLSVLDPTLATVKPVRIRYNSVDGYIYIPDTVTNSVVIFNPISDTIISVKTGFDTPVDVVFTASKKFAVQQGSTGLKEIT